MAIFRVLAASLARLGVGRKLALIYLLDLTAVIFISGILIEEKFIAIDFARKEVAGNAYIRALRPSLVALGGVQLASSPATAPSPGALRAAEFAHGRGMDSAAANQAYRHALAALHDGLAQGGPAVLAARQSAAIDRGRQLVTRIGNQSNLILDPDLDSYYTMSIILLRYPELLELVAGIGAGMEQQALSGRPAVPDARTQYFILEGRLDATAKGIDQDHREAFAAAANTHLRDALEPRHARLAERVEQFRRAARSMLDEGGSTRLAQLLDARRQLLAELEQAWAGAADEMDRLLQARIDGFFVRMWLHLGIALTMLALILTAVVYVARQISVPLRRLSDVVDTVRRTGDHGLRASWHSSDEIGRLVVGFNGMLAQLDAQREVQQELAANARAAAAQRDLVEAIPIPLMVTAVPGHEVLHANAPARAWLGGRQTDPWAVGLEPAVRARFFQSLADRGAVDEFEVQWRRSEEPAWAVLSARRLSYHGQDAVLTAFAPINHLKVMEQRLELWAKVFEASSEAIVIIDGTRRIVTVNHAFCRHTGYEQSEAVGQSPAFLLASDDGHDFFGSLWTALHQRGAWQGEVRMQRRNGSSYPAWLVVSAVRDGQGGMSHCICTSLDISDRKASEERIHYLAHHDVLTGLPNRSLCIERLRLALQHARRAGHRVAVLFIDLDRFKTINDSLGHHVGDALLKSVSERLLQAVRAVDTVSRLGGDEFIVVLDGVADADEVLGIVERRLVPLVRQVHRVGGAELHVSCSVGIALYPDDATDLDEILRHADVAMYQAKALGRDGAQFFTPEMNERAHQRLRIESLLRHAVERGELVLHYQPRVAARDGSLRGVEALLRWHSPELGEVPPASFIPIAEESRLIVTIGAWVLREACRQQAAWAADGLGVVPVSINVSTLQLRDEAFLQTLQEALARAHAPSIELELTESTLMEAAEHTLAQLEALKALGVKLAVDDFGTGYSSLSYLKRFPIDRLKVDRSFVRDLLDDPIDGTIVRAIISLGHALELQVVAEGVESEPIAAALRAAGCDELQGYHFAQPLPPHALARWIRTGDAGDAGSDQATSEAAGVPG
jgi:diguanylate cyclase (GGDEF)-like protein/PAS domain S-box-containing protein